MRSKERQSFALVVGPETLNRLLRCVPGGGSSRRLKAPFGHCAGRILDRAEQSTMLGHVLLEMGVSLNANYQSAEAIDVRPAVKPRCQAPLSSPAVKPRCQAPQPPKPHWQPYRARSSPIKPSQALSSPIEP